MYLRQGWLVGNGGLLGAWLILGICLLITTTTALSLSSIATNVRLHAGGAYAIISRSLGKETGGTVGFMLYLAQSLAIVMYIFGFREGWLGLFPTHTPIVIDVLCFIAMMVIVRFFQDLAFKLQYLIFAITILSVASVSHIPFNTHWSSVNWVGNFGGSYDNFWSVLGVFFPAVTGILAGASLSGQLSDPREAIPKGTLSAVLVAGSVYAWLSIVYAGIPQQELLSNYTIMQSISVFPGLIGFAVVGATFCAGLATLVGAPQIFRALCIDNILPKSTALQHNHNPLWLTGALVLLGIFIRDLNSIAPLITICFLTTYGTINIIVLIEQQLGLLSFRPTLRLPQWVPLIGAIGCITIALVVNPTVSLLVLCIIGVGVRRLSGLDQGIRQDVRTNLFLAMARWAARKSMEEHVVEGKAWMPFPIVPILTPTTNTVDESELIGLARDLVMPNGTLRILSIQPMTTLPVPTSIFIQHSHLDPSAPEASMQIALQTLFGTFWQPNILCMDTKQAQKISDLDALWRTCLSQNIGIIYRSQIPHTVEAMDAIHVWIRPQTPHWDLSIAQQEGSLDLALLLAIQISKSQNLPIRLVTTLINPDEHASAEEYLDGLVTLGRLPKNTSALAFVGNIWTALPQSPRVKIQIFGMPSPLNTTESVASTFIQRVESSTYGTCLFVRGSGSENLLA